MCLFSWERTQTRDRKKLVRADFRGQKRGPKRAILGHKKFSLLFVACPYILKTLQDSVLLRRSAFTTSPYTYYVVNPCLRGEMPVKPRKMMSAQGGRHSKSLCGSKFTMHSKCTTAWSFSTAGSFGKMHRKFI